MMKPDRSTPVLALALACLMAGPTAEAANGTTPGGSEQQLVSDPIEAKQLRHLVAVEPSVDRTLIVVGLAPCEGAEVKSSAFGTPKGPMDEIVPLNQVKLCVTNTNRFTDENLGLVPGDRFVFRFPAECMEFEQVSETSCEDNLSVVSALLDKFDFECSVESDEVIIEYTLGRIGPFPFEEKVCLDVRVNPDDFNCLMQYRFEPRPTAFGRRGDPGYVKKDGKERIDTPHYPNTLVFNALPYGLTLPGGTMHH